MSTVVNPEHIAWSACVFIRKNQTDQFPTYYFACSHKARYNKPIRILKLWKTSNHQSSQSETVRAIDSFVYTISYDMTDLDKTKRIWLCDREMIGAILFLAGFLVAAKLCWKGDDRTELKISRDMFDLFISVFLVRCLNDTSWKVATDEITYLITSHLLFPLKCWKKCLVCEVVLLELQGTHFNQL